MHNIKLALLVVLIFSAHIQLYGQDISPQKQQEIIDSLRTTNFGNFLEAKRSAIQYHLVGAIPVVEDRFWSMPYDIRLYALDLLVKLNASSVSTLAHTLIDSAGTLSRKSDYYGEDSTIVRLKCSKALYDVGDYSATAYIFDAYHKNLPGWKNDIIDILPSVVRHDAFYADSAVNLLRLYIADPDSNVRLETLESLGMPRDCLTFSFFFDRLFHDPTINVRNFALNILDYMQFTDKEEVMLNVMQNDTTHYMRWLAAEKLLDRYGTPQNFNRVMVQWKRENGSHDQMDFEVILDEFQPTMPDSSTSFATKLDTLISLKHQIVNLQWLGDSSFVKELDSLLEISRNYLFQGDTMNSFRGLKIFQHRIIEEYEDSLSHDNKWIKGAGAIFLFYYAEYIIDVLPSTPPIYQLRINSIGSGYIIKMPDQLYYDSASVMILNAIPESGYSFFGWSGGITGSENPAYIQILQDTTVTATYNLFL